MPALDFDTRTQLSKVHSGIEQLQQGCLPHERTQASASEPSALIDAQANTDFVLQCVLGIVVGLLGTEPSDPPLAPYWAGNGYLSEDEPNCGTDSD